MKEKTPTIELARFSQKPECRATEILFGPLAAAIATDSDDQINNVGPLRRESKETKRS